MSSEYFRPGTGRGTSRRMVEGASHTAGRLQTIAPSTTVPAAPLPVSGRKFK